MRSFLVSIKNTTKKAFISDINYLTKMSHAHAHNTYNDDDKDIIKSLKEQTQQNKIKKNLDYDLFTFKADAHAFACIPDEDDEIIKSLNEQILTTIKTQIKVIK